MLGPDKLLTLIVFAVLTVASAAAAVWLIGREPTRKIRAQASAAMVTAIVGAISMTGIQMNRTLGYAANWSDVPGLFFMKPDGKGSTTPVRRPVPRPEAGDPELPGHHGDSRGKVKFTKDSNGAYQTKFRGPISGISLPVWVWTPKNYSPTNGKIYKVMLMLHGYPGNPYKVPTQLNLQNAMKKHPNTIMAIPSLKVDATSPDCVDIKGRPAVGSWVVNDIVGMVRHNFPNTEKTRKGWTIAGASYGAYCSAVLGLTHPQIFSKIISFSGYDQPETGRLLGAPPRVRREFSVSNLLSKQKAWPQRLYVTGSKGDPKSAAFVQKLKRISTPAVKITSLLQPIGGHNWGVWRKELPAALAWNGKG